MSSVTAPVIIAMCCVAAALADGNGTQAQQTQARFGSTSIDKPPLRNGDADHGWWPVWCIVLLAAIVIVLTAATTSLVICCCVRPRPVTDGKPRDGDKGTVNVELRIDMGKAERAPAEGEERERGEPAAAAAGHSEHSHSDNSPHSRHNGDGDSDSVSGRPALTPFSGMLLDGRTKYPSRRSADHMLVSSYSAHKGLHALHAAGAVSSSSLVATAQPQAHTEPPAAMSRTQPGTPIDGGRGDDDTASAAPSLNVYTANDTQ